ncbi:hypothetical protein FRC01_004540, partial [Tulasnella sp. 417]
MHQFYAVQVGRNPGVYRLWRDAKAQTNGFSGSVHAGFNDLHAAVVYSGIPINRQPLWVREALGVPDPAAANPPAASGPPPYSPPASSVSHSSSTGGLNMVTAQVPQLVTTSASNNHESMQQPTGTRSSTPTPVSSSVPQSEAAHSLPLRPRNQPPHPTPASSNNEGIAHWSRGVYENAGSQTGQVGVAVHHEGSAPVPAHAPLSSPTQSPVRSSRIEAPPPSQVSSPVLGQRFPDNSQWSSTDHPGWVADSLLSGVFHPPAASESVASSTRDSTGNSGWSSSEVWVDPMEPMPEGLYGAL